MASPADKPKRLPLSRTGGRLSFERRLRLWLAGLCLPAVLLASALTFSLGHSWVMTCVVGLLLAGCFGIAGLMLFEQMMRPMQTLANVVAALRADDFSFRARGGRRGDALGDLSLEINALAQTLQAQRSTALDALTLVERVLLSMQSPVLAFDEAGALRLSNAAARAGFALEDSPRKPLIGTPAEQLKLGDLLTVQDQGRYPAEGASAAITWSVRRAAFRLHGRPHTLFVLTDLGAALREEERLAWQRLIRVLGHEINNSLTPIKSIAGSLQSRLRAEDDEEVLAKDMQRGLAIIEDRAASLNRFLQAYQRLSRLPAPALQPVALGPLLAQVASVERRLAISLEPGPEVTLLLDADQMQQALINLLQNAVDAALSEPDPVPLVSLTWSVNMYQIVIHIADSGPGITNPGNLFVPFYTTKPGGSGIGLVLAQQIAHAHGGSVALRSVAGERGCVAEMILPVR